MSNLFNDHRIARYVKLNAIMSCSDAKSSGQRVFQWLGAADLRPMSQSLINAKHVGTHGSGQPIELPLCLWCHLHLSHRYTMT